MSLEDQFIQEVNNKLRRANFLYGSPFDWTHKVSIEILNFNCIGRATYFENDDILIEFSKFHVSNFYDHMVKVVIPHEVAHVVGYLFPELHISSHNLAWQKTDILLGGTGEIYWQGNMT